VRSAEFADALAKGLIRFANFLHAKKITADSIQPAGLRKEVQKQLKTSLE
jgi:hypothetical protein